MGVKSGVRVAGCLLLVAIVSSCGARRQSSKSRIILTPEPARPIGKDSVHAPVLKRNRTGGLLSVILPLKIANLKSASTIEIEKSALALDFYQGLRCAADSLAARNQKFSVAVFDTQDDSTQMPHILQSDLLQKSRVVIGPIFPSEIRAVSRYATESKTLFVSPLAPHQVESFHNPYLVACASPLEVYAKKTAEYVSGHTSSPHVIYLQTGQADQKFIALVKGHLSGESTDVSVVGQGSFSAIKSSLKTAGQNVLVVASLDKAFWSRLLIYLSQLENRPLVFAHPGFERMNFQNTELLHAAGVRYASTYLVDYKSSAVQQFSRIYKSKWGVAPSHYSFLGFDLGLFFGQLASAADRSTLTVPHEGLTGKVAFKDTGMGYTNESVMMLGYSSGHLAEE